MEEKGRGDVTRARHRRYFLWNTVQPRLITLSLFYQIVIIAAVAGAVFIPLTQQLDPLSIASHDALSVASEFLFLHSRFWPVVLVATLLVLLHSVVFFHRIAGPLYRFRQIFRAVEGGDLLVRTAIRSGDYLHPEAECLSAMLTSLQSRISRIEGHYQEITLSMDRLKDAIGRNSLAQAQEEAEQLELISERLSETLELFRRKSISHRPADPLLISPVDR